jgi:hypothetical protein
VLVAPWTSRELMEAGVRRCSSSCREDLSVSNRHCGYNRGRSELKFTILAGPV